MSEQRRPRVLIADPIAEEGVELLRQYFDVDVREGLTPEELEAIIPNYEALIVRSATRVTSRIIEAGRRLRVIGRAGTGLDNIDVSTARALGVEVLNCPGANSVAVAEHTIGLMLALARHIPAADHSMKAGRWEKKRFKGTSLDGKTLGIIGFGRIGRQVAKRAKALGMRVLVNQPRLTPELALEAGVTPVDLPDLLRESDFVSLHVPWRPENENLIDREELALMKPTAYLINTARGGIVNEEALLEALNEGRIAGAGIDVFKEEPALDHPLAKHPKVVATPHIGASTVEAQKNAAIEIAEKIIEFLGGTGSVAETLSLQMVELSKVVPHEGVDPKRVERLARAIEADGRLANPPVVAAWQDKYIVLDGATRTTALKELGIPHIVVQVVDPNRADVALHTWYHVVSGPSAEAFLDTIQRVPGLVLEPVADKATAESALRERQALAYLVLRDGRHLLARLADETSDALDVLNAMVEAYTDWGEVDRTLTTDMNTLTRTYPEAVALVIFPQFTPDEVLAIAGRGRRLPQGITRFVIPGRVLRLNVPLDVLRSDEPLPAKRRWLDQFVREKLERRRVRYYQEPVILLED